MSVHDIPRHARPYGLIVDSQQACDTCERLEEFSVVGDHNQESEPSTAKVHLAVVADGSKT